MSHYDYKAAIANRIKDINEQLGQPQDPKAVGHIDYRREGIKHYSVFRVANEHGGTRSLRNAGSLAEVLDYLEGYLDGIRAGLKLQTR